MAAIVLGIAFLSIASSAGAFELLSWWRRDLIELRIDPGDWVSYEMTEINEDGVFVDSLTVRVYRARDPEARWIGLTGRDGELSDLLRVRPELLRRDIDPLDAVDSLLRRSDDGRWIPEDLRAHRQSRLVQRHLSDPFRDPVIERSAMADTTIADRPLTRERVHMAETQSVERPLGRSTLIITTQIEAEATLSPAVPLAGVLWARTVTIVTSRTEDSSAGRRRRQPPLVGERWVRCLAFGHDETRVALPAGR